MENALFLRGKKGRNVVEPIELDAVMSCFVSISECFSEVVEAALRSGLESVTTVGIGVKIKSFLFMDSI